MTEMLGNQYFMARKFDKALPQLEKALAAEPQNDKVRKKLIICYCEVGHVQKALKLFDRVTAENIELIALTNIEAEDCPCPELVERRKIYEQLTANSLDFYSIMGMLNLYCSAEDSLKYFNKALKLKPGDACLARLQQRISSYAKHVVRYKKQNVSPETI